MKKILLILFVTILLATVVTAQQGEGIHEPGTGIDNPEVKASGTGQGLTTTPETDTSEDDDDKGNGQEVQKQERIQNPEEMGEGERIKNQNQVRTAVQAIHALGNRTGGIGEQIREIARNMDNSINKTAKSEEKIQRKSGFARFLTGGDEEAADEIETEIETSEEMITELETLIFESEDDELTTDLEAQITTLKQEQQRLKTLTQKEKKSKGIFGWMWK